MKFSYQERLAHSDQILVGLFTGGAAGGFTLGLINVIFDGWAWPLAVVTALLGAAILPIAELASRLVSAWWTKGLLLGATAGALIGVSSHAIWAEGSLLADLFASVIGGVVGGMIWKYAAPFEKGVSQNDTVTHS